MIKQLAKNGLIDKDKVSGIIKKNLPREEKEEEEEERAILIFIV